MVSVRSQFVLQVSDPKVPRLMINPLKRILFGVIAVVLAAALFVGSAASETIEPSLGLVFFMALMLVSLVIAAYGKSWVFLLDAQHMEQRWSIFGMILHRRRYPLASLHKIQIEQVRLLPDTGRNKEGSSLTMKASYFERRRYYFKLVLLFSDHRLVIDDGTDGTHMKLIAKGLATALGTSWTCEEV